jgi:hypothetical protein
MPAEFSALICDDVRLEASGKLIIIGAYAENLGAFDFPVNGVFCCLFKADGLRDDAKELSLVMRHIGYPKSEKTYDISNRDGSRIVMLINGVPIKAKRPGEFCVEVSIDGGRYRKIERLPIIHADDPEIIQQA